MKKLMLFRNINIKIFLPFFFTKNERNWNSIKPHFKAFEHWVENKFTPSTKKKIPKTQTQKKIILFKNKIHCSILSWLEATLASIIAVLMFSLSAVSQLAPIFSVIDHYCYYSHFVLLVDSYLLIQYNHQSTSFPHQPTLNIYDSSLQAAPVS